MKYMYVILLLMAGLIAAAVVAAWIFMGLGTLNQNNDNSLSSGMTVSAQSTPAPRPTFAPTPEPDVPYARDPIVGSWMNGMVFLANGTVGGEGKRSWRINENENNSYFVISEGAPNAGSISSTEWVYNPGSDQITRRGSAESFSRGVPPTVFTPTPAITYTQIPVPTLAETGNGTTKKFSYTDCIDACKLNYWADRHIGMYNDCLNTCNIENLKVPG